jgi:hypothetical protein
LHTIGRAGESEVCVPLARGAPQVRSPNGVVYERSTIEFWLETRGAVCPITHKPLRKGELEPAAELRTKIMRFHIQKHAAMSSAPAAAGGDEEDIYDF